MMKQIRGVACAIALASIVGGVGVAAQTGSSPLVVTAVVTDTTDQFIQITGTNFGPAPAVALNLVPLVFDSVTPSQIVAQLPAYPPGTYLLTISRGHAPFENWASDFTIGAVGPKGDTGDKGDQGPPGVDGLPGTPGSP